MGENKNRRISFSIANNPTFGNCVFLKDLDAKDAPKVRLKWEIFSDAFYSSRTFPLNNYTIPKVVQYYSPLFDIEGKSHSFLFKSMNPKIISYQNELGDIVEGYIPWTHCFILINHDDMNIVEYAMFFSETQIKSEFLHDFFVPNIESDYLKVSPILESLFGISVPVYSLNACGQSLPYSCEKSYFAYQVKDAWQVMTEFYVKNCKLETVISTDINDIKDKFITHCADFENPVSIEVFESFCNAQSLTTKSFYQMLCDLYDEHRAKDQNAEYPLPNMKVNPDDSYV